MVESDSFSSGAGDLSIRACRRVHRNLGVRGCRRENDEQRREQNTDSARAFSFAIGKLDEAVQRPLGNPLPAR